MVAQFSSAKKSNNGTLRMPEVITRNPGPPRGPSTETIFITPELAKEWLAQNDNIRPISEGRVGVYVQLIKLGKWKLTHQGIAFDEFGKLIDGQHRLTAIARSGVGVYMMVTRNMSPDAISAFDTGASRDCAAILRSRFTHVTQGRDAKRISSILSAIQEMYTRTKIKSEAELLVPVYEANKEGVDWALATFPQRRSVPAAVCGALAWAYPVSPEHIAKLGEMMRSCMSADTMPAPGPAVALYTAIGRSRANGDTRLGLFGKVLHGAAAFCQGRSIIKVEDCAIGWDYFRRGRVELGMELP